MIETIWTIFAGIILSVGFSLFVYDMINREIDAIKAAHWLYKELVR